LHRKTYVSLLAGIALISASSVFGAVSASAAEPRKFKEISTPGKYSQWAFVEQKGYAYAAPSKSSAKVARLKLTTYEGTDNLVYVEAQTVGGSIWYRVRIPGKSGSYTKPDGTPGGQSVWVPRSALGALQAVRTYIKINRANKTLTFIKGGRTVSTFSVGVGRDDDAQHTPTPPGEYYVRMKMSGFPEGGAYGNHALGLSATSEQLESTWRGGGFIGIHGTNEPKIIPGAVSHGCVRMRNGDMDGTRKKPGLFARIPVGTPVTIE